jgi:hypothetical protein
MYKGGDIVIILKRMRITEYEFDTVAKRFGDIFLKEWSHL